MKKTAFLLIALVLLVHSFTYGQGYKGKGKVKGVVKDMEGNPIEGVKIILYSQRGASGFEVKTDLMGEWKAFYIRGGSWDIDFEKSGYIPKKINVNINEFGKNPDIEIRLEKIEGLAVSEELREELKKGNTLYDEGKYEEAIQVYQVITQKFPDAHIFNRNIGNCYFQMEKYDLAEEYYLKVLDRNPDDNEAMLYIGNTYINRGQNDKALEWYNKIEFQKIQDPLVLYNIGSGFYTQGQHQEALKYYRKAVELKSDFLDALYQLGLVNLALGNNQEAIEVFRDYLKLDSDTARADQVSQFIEILKKK